MPLLGKEACQTLLLYPCVLPHHFKHWVEQGGKFMPHLDTATEILKFLLQILHLQQIQGHGPSVIAAYK